MANHKSSEKRIRSTKTKQLDNKYHGKTVRNSVKKIRNTDEPAEVAAQLPKVVSMLDKLAKKSVIHKNKASNLKSKLMKNANAAKVKA
ncbi:MAG: 30S ribosomal protein S20 [Bacteroidetes bacterium]|nr:30S ribosomal protein S20 [Bacteroidota bacterium]